MPEKSPFSSGHKAVTSLQPDIFQLRALFLRIHKYTRHIFGSFGKARALTQVTLVLSSYCARGRGSISRLDGLCTKFSGIFACFLVALLPIGCGLTVNSPTATGKAVPVTLSALSCTNASMTGSGSDNCTVTLTAAAGSGGLSVSLASSNAAIAVPAAVVVSANATSGGFTATVSSVTAAQSVTLTASAGSVFKTFTLQLNAAAAGSQLTVSPASLAFGDVTVNTSSTLPVTLTSSGMAAVTINSGALTGSGYTMSGVAFPVTLSPGLAVTLEVQFDPTVAGAAAGQLSIQSNSSTNATVVVSLTGTGENAGVAHHVDLSWNAPSSSAVPVVGYNIYRSTGGTSAYQLINSSVDTQTTYMDSAVQSGSTYDYIVESVDSSGVESVPSNEATATIP
jgi:hypothetical protein